MTRSFHAQQAPREFSMRGCSSFLISIRATGSVNGHRGKARIDQRPRVSIPQHRSRAGVLPNTRTPAQIVIPTSARSARGGICWTIS
jgi:hypothetical protein